MPLRGGVCGRVGNDGISVSHLETPVQKEACPDQLVQHTHTHTHTHTHGPSIHRDTHSPLTHELTNACCKGILTLSTRPSPCSVDTFTQATAQIRTGTWSPRPPGRAALAHAHPSCTSTHTHAPTEKSPFLQPGFLRCTRVFHS